jgi:crossover junction endodeoxyribonuclease RusA
MSGPATIELPFPPSTNAIWRAVNGRNIKSKPYRVWEREAGTELLTQNPDKHEGPVNITMTFGLPDKRRRDIDNLAKPVNDLLVKHQVIQRDDVAFLRSLTLKIGEGFTGVRVDVLPISEAEGAV